MSFVTLQKIPQHYMKIYSKEKNIQLKTQSARRKPKLLYFGSFACEKYKTSWCFKKVTATVHIGKQLVA